MVLILLTIAACSYFALTVLVCVERERMWAAVLALTWWGLEHSCYTSDVKHYSAKSKTHNLHLFSIDQPASCDLVRQHVSDSGVSVIVGITSFSNVFNKGVTGRWLMWYKWSFTRHLSQCICSISSLSPLKVFFISEYLALIKLTRNLQQPVLSFLELNVEKLWAHTVNVSTKWNHYLFPVKCHPHLHPWPHRDYRLPLSSIIWIIILIIALLSAVTLSNDLHWVELLKPFIMPSLALNSAAFIANSFPLFAPETSLAEG